MKLEELVLDFSVYPRHAGVDTRTVSVMVTAYQVGARFPPIVIDRKTKRVVDGFHRWNVYKALVGQLPHAIPHCAVYSTVIEFLRARS